MLSYDFPAPESDEWLIISGFFQEFSRKSKQEIRMFFTRGRQPAFEADLR
jgi:hypothetical protein